MGKDTIRVRMTAPVTAEAVVRHLAQDAEVWDAHDIDARPAEGWVRSYSGWMYQAVHIWVSTEADVVRAEYETEGGGNWAFWSAALGLAVALPSAASGSVSAGILMGVWVGFVPFTIWFHRATHWQKKVGDAVVRAVAAAARDEM